MGDQIGYRSGVEASLATVIYCMIFVELGKSLKQYLSAHTGLVMVWLYNLLLSSSFPIYILDSIYSYILLYIVMNI